MTSSELYTVKLFWDKGWHETDFSRNARITTFVIGMLAITACCTMLLPVGVNYLGAFNTWLGIGAGAFALSVVALLRGVRTQEYHELIQELDTWVARGDAEGQYVEARSRILECYTSRKRVLDLCHLNLATVPEAIFQFYWLTNLDLPENRLTEFPQGAMGTSSSVHVNLYGNQITSLPTTFWQLPRHKLKNINIFGNPLPDRDMQQLAQKRIKPPHYILHRLTGGITSDSTLSDAMSNGQLDLSRKHLTTLPDSWRFCILPHLRKLNLQRNNFTEIPEFLFHLNLASPLKINLRNNPISEAALRQFRTRTLPANLSIEVPQRQGYAELKSTLGAWSSVTERTLYFSWLSGPSTDTSRTNAARAILRAFENRETMVDLRDMGLTSLPGDEILRIFSDLRELNLSGNQLTEFPFRWRFDRGQLGFGLEAELHIDLSNNQIRQLPAIVNRSHFTLTLDLDPISLKGEQKCWKDSMGRFALNFGRPTNILVGQWKDWVQDSITPAQRRSRSNVKKEILYSPPNKVDLSGFDCPGLPIDLIFESFPRLQSLTLANTHLDAFPCNREQLERLEKLDLKNCRISEVPEWIFSLKPPKALQIDLRNNPLPVALVDRLYVYAQETPNLTIKVTLPPAVLQDYRLMVGTTTLGRQIHLMEVDVYLPHVEKHRYLHLEALSRNIETLNAHDTSSPPLIRVQLLDLNPDGSYRMGRGIDEGGLTRDYLEGLVRSFAEDTRFFSRDGLSGLAIPKNHELTTLRRLGQVMMYCYYQLEPERNLLIGRHFDPAVFAMALRFTNGELDNPLRDQAKIRLLKTFLAARESSPTIESLQHLVALLEHEHWDPSQREEALDLARDVYYCLPDDSLETIEASELTNAHVRTLRGALLGIFDDALYGTRAIAQGMRSVCERGSNGHLKWDYSCIRWNASEFERSIQGVRDRTQIAGNIQTTPGCNATIRQKITWLRDWISSDATEEELSAFLRLITGSSSLPAGAQIRVSPQGGDPKPYPIFHTCGLHLEIASEYVVQRDESEAVILRDDTKENFIAALKAMFGAAGYSQG